MDDREPWPQGQAQRSVGAEVGEFDAGEVHALILRVHGREAQGEPDGLFDRTLL